MKEEAARGGFRQYASGLEIDAETSHAATDRLGAAEGDNFSDNFWPTKSDRKGADWDFEPASRLGA